MHCNDKLNALSIVIKTVNFCQVHFIMIYACEMFLPYKSKQIK